MGQAAQRSSVQPSPDFSSVARRRSSSNNEYSAGAVNNIRPATLATPQQQQAFDSTNSLQPYDRRNLRNIHVSPTLTTYADLALSNECYAEVQYSFYARDYGELSIHAGQYVQLIERQKHASSAWCLAINLSTQQHGLIPKRYLREVRQIETEEWYFGTCSRIDAEEYLSHISNTRGAFLVRVSERDRSCLALSMRDHDDSGATRIKHYKIKTNNQGRFLISVHQSFPTVKSLIHHHKTHQTSLNYYLRDPCRWRPARHFPAGPTPDIPPRQFADAAQPPNGFQSAPIHNFAATPDQVEDEQENTYPNLLQELSMELPSLELNESIDADGTLVPIVENSQATNEEAAEVEENIYFYRDDTLIAELEEISDRAKRPPSIKTEPPTILLNGGGQRRPVSDMLSWEPLEMISNGGIPKAPIEEEDEDVFEATQPDVQLVQQQPVEIKAMQSIILQRKLGDGYFGDVWIGIVDGKEVTLLIVKPPQEQEKVKYAKPLPKQRKHL